MLRRDIMHLCVPIALAEPPRVWAPAFFHTLNMPDASDKNDLVVSCWPFAKVPWVFPVLFCFIYGSWCAYRRISRLFGFTPVNWLLKNDRNASLAYLCAGSSFRLGYFCFPGS